MTINMLLLNFPQFVLGKEFTCSPGNDEAVDLKILCERLSRRVCVLHPDPTTTSHNKRRGKRKHVEDTSRESHEIINKRQVMSNIKIEPDSEDFGFEDIDLSRSVERNSRTSHMCHCIPDTAYDLLERLLELQPHKRITADEALHHPFVEKQFKMTFGDSE